MKSSKKYDSMNTTKIYKHVVNIRLRDKQFQHLENICNEVQTSKAEFIRDALDEKIDRYLAESK